MLAQNSRRVTASADSGTGTRCGLCEAAACALRTGNTLEFPIVLKFCSPGKCTVDDRRNIWTLRGFVGHPSSGIRPNLCWEAGCLIIVGCCQDCDDLFYLVEICQHFPIQLRVTANLK